MNTILSFTSRLFSLLILLFCLGVFLFGTTTGLRTIIWALQHQLPGTLHIEGIQGRLFDKFSFATLHYQLPDYTLSMNQSEIVIQEPWPHLKVQLTANVSSPIQTKVVAVGTWSELQAGNLKITLPPYDLPIKTPKEIIHIAFNGGTFIIDTKNAQAIQGSFGLDMPSLDFLNQTQDGMQVHGQLHATLTTSGTLSNPKLSGKITLNKGSLVIPDWGIALNPIEATLTSEDKQWHVTGLITTGPHKETLSLAGFGSFAPTLTGEWSLKGENVLFINPPEYMIRLSPNLTLNLKEGAYTLTGRVLVPQAEIKPMTFSETVNLTDDAVFVTVQPKTPELNLTTNIVLDMGKAVSIDLKGLHGLLDGSLKLVQKPNQALAAEGILLLREGRYQSYGQQLRLEDSQLIFSGETLTNPKAHIRAIREINQAKTTAADVSQLFNFKSDNIQNMAYGNHIMVGIDISGRIKTPKVTLFSSPATLSQADILSFLLLGKPASQASKSGGQLLVSAVNALNIDSTSKGAKLLQDLKARFPVDLDIQNNSQSSSVTNALNPGTTVGIGKSLTDRAYLHYTVDLFQDNNNVLTLTYLLNKFFSIQVSASDIGNGIDLLYTHKDP